MLQLNFLEGRCKNNKENSSMNFYRVCISEARFRCRDVRILFEVCFVFITRRPFQVCNNNFSACFLFLLVDMRGRRREMFSVLRSVHMTGHGQPVMETVWGWCTARWHVGQQQPQREGHQASQIILKTGSVFWVLFKYQKVLLGLMVPKHLLVYSGAT